MTIAVGLSKGFKTTQVPRVKNPRSKKGQRIGKKTLMVRSVIREVAGLMPYEKRILDMIKVGGASAEKRMYKFAKKRLGTHKRAIAKRDSMKEVYAQQRARQAQA